MSGGIACTCHKGSHSLQIRKHRQQYWRIVQYKANRSAFNGYRTMLSAYSEIRCLKCGHFWRTKAAYVNELPLATREEVMRSI
jgi:hypothetical protein